MARRRNAWITPLAAGDNNVCRQLSIPENFTHIVSGALAALTEPYRFEQIDPAALTPARCAELMSAMVEQYLDSTCGGTQPTPELQPLRRVSPTTGRIEQYSEELGWFEVDDGETYWPDPVAAPQRPAGQDPVCLAAANAANVVMQVYDQMLDDWNENEVLSFAYAAFLTTLGALTAVLLGAPAVIASLVWSAFSGAYAAFEVGTQNARNSTTQKKLTCLFADNFTIDAQGVVAPAWQPIMTGLITSGWHGSTAEDWLLGWQINYILQVITYRGLIAAANTTAITSYDCDTCDEEPQPSCDNYVVTFDLGKPSWVLTGSGHVIGLYPAPTWNASVGNSAAGCMQSSLSGTGTEHAVDLLIDLGADCTLDYVSFMTRVTTYGGGTSFPYYIQAYNAAGALLHSIGAPQNVSVNWVKREVWYGTSGLANVRYVRCLSVTLPAYAPLYVDDIDLRFK